MIHQKINQQSLSIISDIRMPKYKYTQGGWSQQNTCSCPPPPHTDQCM